MSEECELGVLTRGGIEDLSRVIGVLTLLGLTPSSIDCTKHGLGLCIEIRLTCEARQRNRCVARIGALVCVIGFRQRTRGPAAAAASAEAQPL